MVDIYGCVTLWFHLHPHSLLFPVGDLLTSTSLGFPSGPRDAPGPTVQGFISWPPRRVAPAKNAELWDRILAN